MDCYSVIGNPIAHSKSPWIHSNFAKNTQQLMEYGLLEAESDETSFKRAVEQFIAKGGRGLNVTMPFKEMAWAMADTLSERAQLAGAVNTLTFKADGQIIGDTTDGVGLVNDLSSHLKLRLSGKKILILGAGGAVKGAIQPLLTQSPKLVHIANRTLSRASDLVTIFDQFGSVSASEYETLDQYGAFDIVINATPANFSGQLPPVTSSIFSAESLAYDMSYAAKPTLFEEWSANNGATSVSNGLGMLVEQAAESFYLWREVRPETSTVLAALRASL